MAEVALWLDYRRSQQAWGSNNRALNRTDEQKQEADIKIVVEDFCSIWAPMAKKTEDAIIPFIGQTSLSKEIIYPIC